MSIRTILRGTVAFLATLFLSASAYAQLFRAYLASDGSDANPCTLVQPCRLLPAALTAVANGGEIWMLDSANYNTATVTIGKSVSILAIPGAVGSVVTLGGPAISITAAGLTVALRNLVIVPHSLPVNSIGVFMTGASSLTIERSLIANLPQDGVLVSGTGTVRVADTIFRNNEGSAVWLQNGATGMISRTQMLGNLYGVVAYCGAATTTTAGVGDSFISGGETGVWAATEAIAGCSARVFVTGATIEGTTFALNTHSSGVGSTLITVSNSMVTSNAYGWHVGGVGAVIKSLGNNHIEDNTNAPVGSLTLTALQ